MNKYSISNNYQDKPQPVNEIKKASSLKDLRIALFYEEYERCADLSRAARNFGATKEEIITLLDEHVKGIKRAEPVKRGSAARF